MTLYDIKLKSHTKPINLKGHSIYKEGREKELSTKINIGEDKLEFYRSWFELNDQIYYYKKDYAVSELLMAELFNSFGLDTVKFDIAKLGSSKGIISPNFRKQGLEYYDFDDFLNISGKVDFGRGDNEYNDVSNVLSSLISEEDKNKLMYKLNRMLALDFFTGQRDRYGRNIIVERNPVNNGVSLCPLTDNSMIFESIPDTYYGFFQVLTFASKEFNLPDDEKDVLDTLRFIRNNIDLTVGLENTLDIDFSDIIKKNYRQI